MVQLGRPFGEYVDSLTDVTPSGTARIPVVESGVPRRSDANNFGGGGGGTTGIDGGAADTNYGGTTAIDGGTA